MGLILSDTNAIIYLLNGDRAIAELFDKNIVSISFITELELLSIKKYSISQEAKIKEIIQEFDIYQYNNLIKQSCINLRRKYSLKLPDSIIAATALAYKIPLITADKQFSQINEIEVSLYTL